MLFSVFGDKAYHFCGIRVFGDYEMNFIVYENYENIVEVRVVS